MLSGSAAATTIPLPFRPTMEDDDTAPEATAAAMDRVGLARNVSLQQQRAASILPSEVIRAIRPLAACGAHGGERTAELSGVVADGVDLALQRGGSADD